MVKVIYDRDGGEKPPYMSDLQLEQLIAAVLLQCDPIRAAASCISPVKTSSSSAFQTGRLLTANR